MHIWYRNCLGRTEWYFKVAPHIDSTIPPPSVTSSAYEEYNIKMRGDNNLFSYEHRKHFGFGIDISTASLRIILIVNKLHHITVQKYPAKWVREDRCLIRIQREDTHLASTHERITLFSLFGGRHTPQLHTNKDFSRRDDSTTIWSSAFLHPIRSNSATSAHIHKNSSRPHVYPNIPRSIPNLPQWEERETAPDSRLSMYTNGGNPIPIFPGERIYPPKTVTIS